MITFMEVLAMRTGSKYYFHRNTAFNLVLSLLCANSCIEAQKNLIIGSKGLFVSPHIGGPDIKFDLLW